MSDSKKPESPENDTADAEESQDLAVRGQDGVTRTRDGLVEAQGEDGGEVPDEELEAAHVGVERYVHAAFFALGILTAYLSGKLLLTAWNSLAEWPEAVRALPILIEYTEEERASFTLSMGAVVGVLLVLRYYRRPAVRSWATSVAGELARVTWPSKDTVTNGTIVVLVAGAIATVYIALLDRLWGYLTNLVYGA